jgi:hypothetical protein
MFNLAAETFDYFLIREGKVGVLTVISDRDRRRHHLILQRYGHFRKVGLRQYEGRVIRDQEQGGLTPGSFCGHLGANVLNRLLDDLLIESIEARDVFERVGEHRFLRRKAHELWMNGQHTGFLQLLSELLEFHGSYARQASRVS